ncbi:hypothetical protein C8R43DRAFT_1208938 [Mycena crocata]|nr:hypothetical protein C8R43DRAFT_1208938 [Mycena crocata]
MYVVHCLPLKCSFDPVSLQTLEMCHSADCHLTMVFPHFLSRDGSPDSFCARLYISLDRYLTVEAQLAAVERRPEPWYCSSRFGSRKLPDKPAVALRHQICLYLYSGSTINGSPSTMKGASTETGFHAVLAQAVWIVRAQDFLKNQTPSVEYALSGIQPFRFAFVSQRIHLPATPAKTVFFPLFFILETSTMTLDALEKDRAPDLEYWLHVELFT